MKATAIGLALIVACAGGAVCAERDGASFQYDAMIARHAQANGVPEALVRRIIARESRYNPKARNGPYWGMMQMSVATARGAGFRGQPSELLDAETNLRYGVRYLAGAYKTARGDHGRAVGFYAHGYYYAAKRQGLLASIGMGRDGKLSPPTAGATPAPYPGVQTASLAAPGPMNGAAGGAPASSARVIEPKSTAPVLASIAPSTRSVPMPPLRGEAPAAGPALAAAAVPVPPVRGASNARQQLAQAATPVRTIDAGTARPVMASIVPTPRPRVEPVATGSISARPALPPRSGATTAQVAAVTSAPIAGPAIPLPTARDAGAPKGKAASSPQALAYAEAAKAPVPIPAPPRNRTAPLPPRR